MFWRFGGYANISTIDSILDKPDVTIEELLEDPDLVQELKQQNSKLIEFLREDTVLERLLQYVVAPKTSHDDASFEAEQGTRTSGGGGGWLGGLAGKRRDRSKSIGKHDEEGEESKEEKQRLKYAYVSCEILSSEVWSIAEAVLENRPALVKFWAYLKTDQPIDAVQAGYFTKVIESLLDKKLEEMLDLFKALDDIVPDMLKHVECPCVMDLLLKIISMERNEQGIQIIDWLQSQNLIPLLLNHLKPDQTSATQTSAGDFLKAIITISANSTGQDTNVIGPNELTRQLVSEECVQTLIECMLSGGNPLTVGVGVIIEVIRKNNSDYDQGNTLSDIPRSSDPIYLGTLLRQFANSVPRFMDLIKGNSKAVGGKDKLKVAFGGTIEPLGFHRFKTCELMAELLHCSNMALLNERGAEAEVKRRDAERRRIQKEHQETDEKAAAFSTSVDSQGFHHARPPSISEEDPEMVRKLDIVNNTEEEFENVNPAEVLVDEIRDVSNEKTAGKPDLGEEPELRPQPLRTDSRTKQDNTSALSPTTAQSASSPTSAGITDRLNSVELDQDALMADIERHASGDQPDTTVVPGASGDREVPLHPEDTPAPLFSKKAQAILGNATDPSTVDVGQPEPIQPPLHHEPPSLDEDQQHLSELDDNNDLPYTIDVDGKPVVGDLLKMQFVEHHVVPTILEFFFRFPWNNFLHNVVYDVIQQVFNGSMERGNNRSLAIDLFETGRITDRIIEGQAASDKSQEENNVRLGYMGHLTLIAEEVVKFTERQPVELLSQTVLDKVTDQRWIDYVEQTLAETRERDNAILGGVRPDMAGGPRQAVLNAVNAASGFNSGGGGGSFSSLGGNNNATPSVENSSNDDNTGGTIASHGGASQYLFSGSSLLSGFSHGSSDEEDEEMEGDGGDVARVPLSAQLSEEDQPTSPDQSEPTQSTIQGPIKSQPSRARREFAKRLAQRQQEAAAREAEESGESEEVDMKPIQVTASPEDES